MPSVTKVTKTVNTDLELADALTNHSVGTIVLAGNLNAPAVSITHLVNLDLGTHTLTGNLDFQVPSQSGTMKLSNGTLTGNLTVNTPLASFTNSATVSGSTTITNVAPGTFTNTGTLHAVTITDADGTRFVNNGTTGTVEVATAGAVTLEGSIANVIVTTANDSITNKGTITNFDAQAPVTLVNTGTVADVKGSSAVAVSGAGEVTKATNTNVTVTPAGVADQSLTKGDELAVSEGVHSTSFTWASTNGVGTNLVEKSGRYSYFNDGAYLDITVKEDNGSNVAFDTLFADMTLVTDDGNVDSIPGTAGRQLADWTGVDTGFFTKLKAASSKSVFYGVRQTGQTTAVGMTRTVGFKAGDSRKIDLALTPKEGIANGTYTVTIQPKQQTGVTTGTDLGTAIMYTFTVANTPQ